MNISRFFGSTNREALRQVRLALGPEALIVSNRRVNGGVEILATDPTSTSNAATAAATPAAAVSATPSPAARTTSPAAFMQEPEENVMGAIGEMRGALENRIDELLWGNQLRGAPQAASLFQTLLGYGFSTALLRAMLKRLPPHLTAKAAFQWARNELITHLPVLTSEDDLWRPGLALALVGPTGVGKTTTIAKLAARCVKRYGPESLVLITTDTYRIGAHEQLKIYGQILRVPVHVVQDAAEFKQVIREIRPDQTILVDNVGISQRDRYIGEQAAMLAGSGRQVNRLLVLNASSHGDTLDEVARTYSNDGGIPLKGCIITKIDEASRLGAALDTAIRYQLPIHYVSNGQKVPENLIWLPATELVDQALVHNKQSRALYSPSEAEFAALMSFSREPDNSAHTKAAEHRRQRLLPGLLSVASGAGAELTMDHLQQACQYIEDSVAASEAYVLWCAMSATPADTTPLATYLDKMIRVARHDYAQHDQEWILVMHDQLRVPLPAGGRAALRLSVLLDDEGRALTVPMQQVGLADGWQSSCGAAAAVVPAASVALLGQITHMNQPAQGLPAVHLFDGAGPGLLRELTRQGVAWLAQSSSVARVQYLSCGATVAAVAKTLVHRSITDATALSALSEVAGLRVADIAIWAASDVVYLTGRQEAALAVQLVSVRIVNRQTGATVKALYGLSNILAEQLAPEVLATWLVLRAEVKAGLRHTALTWQHLAQKNGTEAVQKTALMASQMGLAAWQLRQDPSALQARTVAASVMGKRNLTQQSTVPALLKLFALKEMMQD